MAIIHKTTMSPGKLDLLAAWLPDQSWYRPTGRPPELARSGGFRLDDPEGEVGIEFMVVTDTSDGEPTAYHVPLTYRGAPLAGAEAALVGTTEHGVLGRRWVYDGPNDPVLTAQLLALFQGRAEPQAQSLSDTPDPSVTARYEGPEAAGTEDAPALTVTRVLLDAAAPAAQTLGEVTAGWTAPDGSAHRGVFASLAAR
ncbi:maltokinase N-terminal cap-like domain-containing protein [Streptomyces goshikiensis]|uniref:maltokinase N-terminal cap-like domain-containing protein n=1 Tax=Streptomyces goshikiensis TaxID=1942 RepID=UPI0033183154